MDYLILQSGRECNFTECLAEFILTCLSAVSTASSIISAISKPFIGKLSDITSRPTTYCVILVFYAVGFAVAASCTTLAAYIVGIAFTAFGKSG